MRIGFTGTSKGMTKAQEDRVESIVDGLRPTEVHHGDCVGADATFHNICLYVGCFYGGPWFYIHPPSSPKARAFCKARDLTLLPEKPYLERNHDIVDRSQVMIATPFEFEEKLRSGTWATVRYARKKNIEVLLVLPNGKLFE